MMKKRFITYSLLFSLFSANAQIDTRLDKSIKIEEVIGDLDKDGIAEKVEVWNTDKKTDVGLKRELRILKSQNSKWFLWKKYDNCLQPSEGGGMMGDPFDYIKIEKGILIIAHNGGSSWKWGYQDKYRFQTNDFKLIGHSGQYGRECEYWSLLDFNLSTGKIIFKKEFQKCEVEYDQDAKSIQSINETFDFKNLNLTLKNRFSKTIKIVTPKYKIDYYF